MSEAKVEIEEVDMNLDEILGTPGGDNILVPEEKKQTIFTNTSKLDKLSFIDKPDEEEDKIATIAAELEKVLNEDIEVEDSEKTTPGRKKVDKNGLVELTNKLIEKKLLTPFEDDKKIEDYTIEDFEELIEANFQDREQKLINEVPGEFFDSLPEELQYAASYVAKGGTDLKGLFKILSQIEETRALDPNDDKDSEVIVRKYLTNINYGDQEEIEDEINRLKDKEEIIAKATQFKPKLDAKEQEQVSQKLASQDAFKKKQQQAAQSYMSSVYETLKPGEINGLKLDKKTQGLLYSGLIEPNYPSMSGRQTNLFGHLLEKYQYVEPNHSLIAECLWLLADPVGYRSKIAEQGKTAATVETVRRLKTAEQEKSSATTVVEKEETKVRRIPRNDNFFKRTN